MSLEKAKAALARKQQMYNAKVAFFVHIVDGQLGGWSSLSRLIQCKFGGTVVSAH